MIQGDPDPAKVNTSHVERCGVPGRVGARRDVESLNDVAERAEDVSAAAFKEAGSDPKAAPVYANVLVGLVPFVGQWWTENRKLSAEKAPNRIAALARMRLCQTAQRCSPTSGRCGR